MKKLNLNSVVDFTLNSVGKTIYRDYCKEYYKEYYSPELITYPTSMQLYEFMEIFGNKLYDPPVEKFEILVDEKDLRN